MYESFFGLRKRPFATAPDADAMVETPAVAEVLARLDRCVRQGRGVAVMTGAAGLGKTQLCHHFVRRFGDEFSVAMLPNASFPTRRGFLQALLAELDQPYQKLGETELRLELTSVAKSSQSQAAGVLLILDEAHRYSDRILEEVRLLANLIEGGEPLIRVILSGQTDLEDKLAEPGLSGLNERVGELVSLPKLTAEESRIYLRERTTFAGGALETLFDDVSVSLLIRACGGIPRCLNQLADHSLLLGYVAERRPINESLVREALDDLKRLPLQWHDPLPVASGGYESSSTSNHVVGSNSRADGAADDIIEIGGLMDDGFDSDEHSVFETTPSSRTTPTMLRPEPAPANRHTAIPIEAERPATESVQDRFARIDAAEARRQWFETLECSMQGPTLASSNSTESDLADAEDAESETVPGSPVVATATQIAPPRPAVNPLETLDRIEPLLAELEADFGSQVRPRTGVTRRMDAGTKPESAPAKVATARVELERLVASLEGAVGPAPATEVAMAPATNAAPVTPPESPTKAISKSGARSTMFSDLRRKQNEKSSDRTE